MTGRMDMEDESKIIIDQMKKLIEKYKDLQKTKNEIVSSREKKTTCIPGDVCNVGEVEES